MPSFAELKTLLGWMREHKADLDLWFRAMALVTDSAVMRGALRGVLILSPVRAAPRFTHDLPAAIDRAEGVLGTSMH